MQVYHLPEGEGVVRAASAGTRGTAGSIPPLARGRPRDYVSAREVGPGERLANPVRSGRKQP